MWSISANRFLGLVPYAHVRRGSVLVKTFYGITHRHAFDRALKWIEEKYL